MRRHITTVTTVEVNALVQGDNKGVTVAHLLDFADDLRLACELERVPMDAVVQWSADNPKAPLNALRVVSTSEYEQDGLDAMQLAHHRGEHRQIEPRCRWCPRPAVTPAAATGSGDAQ